MLEYNRVSGKQTGAIPRSMNSTRTSLLTFKLKRFFNPEICVIQFRELRGKFLKKRWCCVGREYNKIMVLSTGLIMCIGHHKEIQKLTFQLLALCRSES